MTARSLNRTARPASRLAMPNLSPPRKWAACAVTGGLRTAARCWSPGSMSVRSGAGTSRIRPTRTARRRRSATRRPARRTPMSRLCLPRPDGSQVRQVDWDRDAYPYLVTASWDSVRPGAPLIVVQSRDQREMRVLTVSPGTGRPASSAPTPTRTGWRSCRESRPGPVMAGSCGPPTPEGRGGCSSPPLMSSPRARPHRSPRPRCRSGRSSASTVTPRCSAHRPGSRPRSACGPTGRTAWPPWTRRSSRGRLPAAAGPAAPPWPRPGPLTRPG